MIRLAELGDIKRIMEIVAKVLAEMRASGSDQWSEEYPAESHFRADLASGELYVDESDAIPGLVRGMACINQAESPEYAEVAWSRSGPATVVHRLAVDPECQKQGVASRLFGLADELARQNGSGYLRSDTYSLNPRMNALFAKLGWRRTGVIRFPRRREWFYCWDKELGDGGH